MKRKAPQEDEFGAFERSTKGFGMKMLLKMGYQRGSGLGKEGEGIVNPIEVKLRARNTGLGFDGEDALTPPLVEEVSVREGRNSPRSNRPDRRKELEEELAELKVRMGATPSVKILDFTGREVRKVYSLSDSVHRPASVSTRFPELRHNVSILVQDAETSLRRESWSKRQDEQLLQRLSAEEGRLIDQIAVIEAKKSEMERLRELFLASTTRITLSNSLHHG